MIPVAKWPWLLFTFMALFALFGLLVLFSQSAAGGADNYSHYRIAKYAFQYPPLFLDHWGKPLFTVLTAPLAQFGFKGVQFFNFAAGLLAAFIAYLTARKLQFANAWLAIIFTCFTPIYFIIMLSGLTEILFSLILMASICLFFHKRYLASSILISLIIFSRTEGIVILPFFLIAYWVEKQCKAIPFLLTGFLVFSVAGYFALGDFWWFFTQNPYTGAKDIYGSGELTHFISNSFIINGIPLTVLFALGTLSYVMEHIRFPDKRKQLLPEGILILFIYLGYLAAHSVAWWQGAGGSLGLIRVMAAVMPLAAIISLRGFNMVFDWLPVRAVTQATAKAIVILLVVIVPFRMYDLPVRQDEPEKIIMKAAEWVKSNGLVANMIYYHHVYFIHLLDLNPFDPDTCHEKIPDVHDPGALMPEGSLLQWDAQFGPNEGRLPLQALTNNPRFRLLKVFKPDIPFQVLNGHNYEVYLFQRTRKDIEQNKG